METPSTFEFGPFIIRTEQRSLFREGVHVKLEPKQFDVLVELVSRWPNIAAKSDLIARYWASCAASSAEAGLTSAIAALRKKLGPEYIENLHSKGYKLAIKVTTHVESAEPAPLKDEPSSNFKPSHVPHPQRALRLWILPGLAVGISLILVIWVLAGSNSKGQTAAVETPSVLAFNETLYRQHPWLNYESTNGDLLTLEGIHSDLETVRSLGFGGIITFRSLGVASAIPRIAHDMGLHVIMGIGDPSKDDEVQAAIGQAEYVDAYSIGHNWLYQNGPKETLIVALNEVRKRTGKPVSTTVYLADYDQVVADVDWLFPDVGLKWPNQFISPDDLFREVQRVFQTAEGLARQYQKAVLLKMIAYPSAGRDGYTEETQAAFYKRISSEYLMRPRLKESPFHSVSLSFHSAYDLPWKTSAGMPKPEEFVGLLTSDARAKPAACELQLIMPFTRDPAQPRRPVGACDK